MSVITRKINKTVGNLSPKSSLSLSLIFSRHISKCHVWAMMSSHNL